MLQRQQQLQLLLPLICTGEQRHVLAHTHCFAVAAVAALDDVAAVVLASASSASGHAAGVAAAAAAVAV